MSSSKSVKSSIRIYGIENHIKTIIEFCKGRKSLVAKEKKTVNDSLLKNELCMNLMPGGLGDLTIELQLRRSSLGGKANALKLKNDPELLKKYKEKISVGVKRAHEKGLFKNMNHATFTGRKHRPESIEKMKKSRIGKQVGEKNSQFGKQWIYNPELKQNKKILKTDSIPIGWIKGRKMKFL